MPHGPETVYLGIGSNIGRRARNLALAAMRLQLTPGIEIQRLSPVYETAPWGLQDQPAFLNMVLAAHTWLSPLELLDTVKTLEVGLGRVASEHWGPRAIDIDILVYGGRRLDTETLTIPHPRIPERQFVLVPLADIGPQVTVAPGFKACELAKPDDPDITRIGTLARAVCTERNTPRTD